MRKYTLLLFVFIFLLHIPFLTADPDRYISFSRDAFTDEGLYTSQVRNYLIRGSFNLNESDAAVKTPLFSIFMFVAFKVAGIGLTTARLAVLLFSLLVIYLIFRKDLLLAGLFSGITLFQYTIFQYNHFALAEFLSVTCLAAAWYFFSKESNSAATWRNVFFACGAVALSWYFKFQYLYMVLWPVLFYILILIYSGVTGSGSKRKILLKLVFAVVFSLLFISFYYLIWYLPSRGLFDYVISSRTEVIFGEGEWFRKMIDFNIDNYFVGKTTILFTWLFLSCLAAFPFVIYYHRFNKLVVFQLLGALSWCLLELYKPALAYLPGRYLVSTFFAMGLFSSLTIRGFYLAIPSMTLRRSAVIIMVAGPVSINASSYISSYSNRSFILQEVNRIVAGYCHEGCTIAGPWAPSVSWMAASPSVPVWKDYFNDRNTMEQYQPCIIVSELDEPDSGNAWRAQGIRPAELAIATVDFKIRYWYARIYILKSGIPVKK